MLDIARLEKLRFVVTGGRERVRTEKDLVHRACWMVKSSISGLGVL